MPDTQPFSDLLGVVVSAEEISIVTGEQHANAGGTVHGGLIATLVDMAMGRAVNDHLDAGQRAVTLQLSVTYLNPGRLGDELVARAEVGKRGESVVLLSADVTTRDGRDLAQAVGTFTVVAAP